MEPKIRIQIALREGKNGLVLQGLDFIVKDLGFREVHGKSHASKSNYICQSNDALCDLKTLLYTIAREDNVEFRIVGEPENKESVDRLESESNNHINKAATPLPSAFLYLKSNATITGPSSTDIGVKFTSVSLNDFQRAGDLAAFVKLGAKTAVPINF